MEVLPPPPPHLEDGMGAVVSTEGVLLRGRAPVIWAPPTSSTRWCCIRDAEPESREGFGERGSEPLWRFQADPCTQPMR